MKNVLTATLVHIANPVGGEQRFYKLSLPIGKFTNGLNTVAEELEVAKKRLAPKFKHIVPSDTLTWDTVCVSDAHTHLERLLFLGCKVDEDTYYILSSLHLDGVRTMMIHGGDERKMYPDKVYLRRLAVANGYKFGGINHA